MKITNPVWLICIVLTLNANLISQNSVKNISSEFDHNYQYQQVADIKLAYYEQGTGDPILFLHGIPDNSYLWRNVIPLAAKNHRAIAVDLPGYGQSEVPNHQDYSIDRHYQYIKKFIENLNLQNVILVVTDIGSLYGLKYAIETDSNIKGIVFIEGMFMPSREWYKSLRLMQKIMFGMMKNEKRAYKMIVEKNKMPKMMLKMSVVRKYSDELEAMYNSPYKDNIERRKIMMYGAGPYTVPPKGISKVKGDFSDELNKIAVGLKRINSTVPFLIIHANPGMIVRKKNIEYARKHFKKVDFFNVGKGKHYLSEDHPNAIGIKISNWSSEFKQ